VTITEFSAGRKRARVCCSGEMPDEAGRLAFRRRGYELEPYAGRFRSPSELAVTDSVIISQDADRLKEIYRALQRHAPTLLNFDCRVYVRVAAAGRQLQGRERTTVVDAIRRLRLPGAGLTRAEWSTLASDQREREKLPLAPYVYICHSSWTWEDIAQVIAGNPAGEPPNLDLSVDAVDAKGKKIKVPRERWLLLSRAFPDCNAVHLRKMQDGLSGGSVYRAYAEVKGVEGTWPATYFVKMGSRTKIATEYDHYQTHALKYIPFNLAPRLALDRCGLGAREGVIVGDFVEHAEALKDCASSGRAIDAIGTLFSRTLGAWRNAARTDDVRSLPQALSYLLPDSIDIPDERKALIRSLGGTPDLAHIRELLDRCDAKPILIGTIHGDLNASNVLVRFSDAILIDFKQLNEGRPLLYDAASVEVGLLVDGFATDRRDVQEWLTSIERLYDSHEMFECRIPCHPQDPSAWFFDCVRQVRLHARQLELKKGQYATALGLAFVKKSCNAHMFYDRRDTLRAAAYLLGERILEFVVAEYSKEIL